jgi:AAA15 family ATPase/GTPase
MKLIQIEISNFRSILNQKIDFKDSCVGLIGLNESGKSNILSAIRALEKNYTLTAKDRSKISGKFPRIDYKFSLDDTEIALIEATILNIFRTAIHSENAINFKAENISTISRVVKIERIAESIQKDVSFEIEFDLTIASELLSQKKEVTIPPELLIRIGEVEHPLKEVKHVQTSLIQPDYLQYFEMFDKQSVLEVLIAWLNESFVDKLPQVIFWEYQPKYLLSSEISYDALIANDNPYENSAPLYNILLLSKQLLIKTVEDLKFKISVWKTDSSERRKDSSIITQSINEYIRSIWSDYNQDLVIELEESKITIHVNDPKSTQRNYYEMEARSQGFKIFISFILTIAAEAENGVVSNFILLLDEPETSLHPSGVRYMKEELLMLSRKGNNVIVFATHSIFMIDRSYLKRHILVSKEHEITQLKYVDRNNFIQEAVIYEAMGTTLDEFSIGPKNIIFEGELDLKLFTFCFEELFLKETVKNITDYDKWDGGGTKRIGEFLTNKMLPIKSDWIVILDFDSPGQNLGKNIDTKFGTNPNFKVRHMHYSKNSNFELEDILSKDLIQKTFDSALAQLEIKSTYEIDFSDETKPVSNVINEFKAKHKINNEQGSLFEEHFKNSLDQNVEQELKNILMKATQPEKLEEFKKRFPLYFEFISQFVEKFFKPTWKVLFSQSEVVQPQS